MASRSASMAQGASAFSAWMISSMAHLSCRNQNFESAATDRWIKGLPCPEDMIENRPPRRPGYGHDHRPVPSMIASVGNASQAAEADHRSRKNK
jgi:hypothetical protein